MFILRQGDSVLPKGIFPLPCDKLFLIMNTKVVLSILACLLFYTSNASAQTLYYTEERTFHGDGFTFINRPQGTRGSVTTLFNQDNRWRGVPITFRDGRPFTRESLRHVSLIHCDGGWNKRLFATIVNNALTPAERERVRGSVLSATLYLCADTGKVDDVKFTFGTRGGFGTVPVTTFRQIELEIKEQLMFSLNWGSLLNFVRTIVMYEGR